MTWHFETDADFQEQLDWIDEFVREEIEPLDFIITSPYDHAKRRKSNTACEDDSVVVP